MSDNLLTRNFFPYISDDGTTYNIATTDANGTTNSATPVSANANPAYPRGFVARHLYGEASNGARTKLPVFDPSNTLWTTASTFTKDGVVYAIGGRIGERRTYKGAKVAS